MNQPPSRSFALVAGAAVAALLGGCSHRSVEDPSAVPATVSSPAPEAARVEEAKAEPREPVVESADEPQDLVDVTDRMARSILVIPEIAEAAEAPRVVLEPVVNETRFPINKDAFLTRVRTQLNSRAAGRVRFLDRENLRALEREHQLKQEGLVSVPGDPEPSPFRGADYFLTGKLQRVSERTTDGMHEAVRYVFQLIDATTSEMVWEDSATIQKQGLENIAYR